MVITTSVKYDNNGELFYKDRKVKFNSYVRYLIILALPMRKTAHEHSSAFPQNTRLRQRKYLLYSNSNPLVRQFNKLIHYVIKTLNDSSKKFCFLWHRNVFTFVNGKCSNSRKAVIKSNRVEIGLHAYSLHA
jgi:hypothetical protein